MYTKRLPRPLDAKQLKGMGGGRRYTRTDINALHIGYYSTANSCAAERPTAPLLLRPHAEIIKTSNQHAWNCYGLWHEMQSVCFGACSLCMCRFAFYFLVHVCECAMVPIEYVQCIINFCSRTRRHKCGRAVGRVRRWLTHQPASICN